MELTRQRKVTHYKGYDIVAEWRKGYVELYYMLTNNENFMMMDYICEPIDTVDDFIESIKGIIDDMVEFPPDYYDCNIWDYEGKEYDGGIMNYGLDSANSLVIQEF